MNKPEQQYAMANSLSPAVRTVLVFGLGLAGFTIQMFLHVFGGLAVMFPAMLLSLPGGASNKPKFSGVPEWKNVQIEEFLKIGNQFRKSDKFKKKSSEFSLLTLKGCGSCLGFLVFVFAVLMVLVGLSPEQVEDMALEPITRGGNLGVVFLLDALLLVVPLWFFGSIKLWEPPKLRKKYNQLKEVYSTFKNAEGMTFTPSLLINKTKDGDVPTDCKLTANFEGAPSEFMGVQVQCTINTVESKGYPYTYCVLVAKPEMELTSKVGNIIENPPPGGFKVPRGATSNEKKEAKLARFNNAVVERKKEQDVHIVVIRQQTGGVGYTTTNSQARTIFGTAVRLAKEIL